MPATLAGMDWVVMADTEAGTPTMVAMAAAGVGAPTTTTSATRVRAHCCLQAGHGAMLVGEAQVVAASAHMPGLHPLVHIPAACLCGR